mmetsp:Transcript_88142/g.227302  ORF Transcript_88142/g.227302 Transcript_88142/m.227302 type:complete len:629 (+) Transcript_88142:128-2014(+)
MLFVPQTPIDSLVNNYPVDPGYMMCMMPPTTSYDNSELQRHVVLPSESNGNIMDMSINPGYDFGVSNLGVQHGSGSHSNNNAPSGPSKALTIRNPKTGEVVGGQSAPEGRAPAKEANEEPATREVTSARRAFLERADLANILLSAAAKSGGGTAAKVMAKRQGGLWCTDRSTFTALNIDVIRRRPNAVTATGLASGGSGGILAGAAREFSITRPQPLALRQSEESSHPGDFSRSDLLAYRHDALMARAPEELRTLRTRMPVQTPPQTPFHSPMSLNGGLRMSPSMTPRSCPQTPCQERNIDDFRMQRRASRAVSSESLPMPSPKAYRPGASTPKPRLEELRRLVQSLLNKICPESVVSIGEKLREVPVETAQELELMISLISKKALSEPHYIETYADLVYGLKAAFPQFPSETCSKSVTFKSVLLNICQSEFETLPTSLEPSPEDHVKMGSEEVEYQRKQTKGRLLANMKFIGHLFLRQLLSARVISSVIQELTLCDREDELPQEHVVECAVELILSIGYTLETMPTGSEALGQVCSRLLDLQQRKLPEGRAAYSKRIQFAIQDLLDVRSAGWRRKTFKAAAKTKEEIRLDQHRDLTNQARGREVESGEQVVVGQRPFYMTVAMEERA